MGNVLPFGRGIDDDSENQPISATPIDTEDEQRAADQAIPADPVPNAESAQSTVAPKDPRTTYKEIDVTLANLRNIAQQIILLSPQLVSQEQKQDLFTQYTALETRCVDIQGRLAPASGDPENETLAQEHERIKLDVDRLTETVTQQIEAAGGKASLGPAKPSISRSTALYIGLGFAALLVTGGLVWAFLHKDDD